jgi:hypothetical protein
MPEIIKYKTDNKPYRSYVALLTQKELQFQAIVLENTLGSEVDFKYKDMGIYRIACQAFKDETAITSITLSQSVPDIVVSVNIDDNIFNGVVDIQSRMGGEYVDGGIYNATLEIRIYN